MQNYSNLTCGQIVGPRTANPNAMQDPHKAFVRHLSTWIPAALTHRGWVTYPKRLNRLGINLIIEEIWSGEIDAMSLIDEDSGSRTSDSGSRIAFGQDSRRTRRKRGSQTASCRSQQWPRLIRQRQQDGRERMSADRDRVSRLPESVRVLISSMSTDPDELQAVNDGPRIVAPDLQPPPPRTAACQPVEQKENRTWQRRTICRSAYGRCRLCQEARG